jgi:hypothetical protein
MEASRLERSRVGPNAPHTVQAKLLKAVAQLTGIDQGGVFQGQFENVEAHGLDLLEDFQVAVGEWRDLDK